MYTHSVGAVAFDAAFIWSMAALFTPSVFCAGVGAATGGTAVVVCAGSAGFFFLIIVPMSTHIPLSKSGVAIG